jgi:16S rRNA (cytosine1402-N4)-methyltransferase
MSNSFHHISVLPKETMELLQPQKGSRFIDGTLGAGGHSGMILETNPDAELIGIDQDREALAAAGKNLEKYGDRVNLFHGTFSQMKEFCAEKGWDSVDGILLDIGVSSHQIDTAERGFSFREDGPLDMRMNRRNPLSASTIINQYSEEQLKTIFKEYGEVKRAGAVARAIVADREKKPFERTGELAGLIDRVDKVTGRRQSSAVLYFQALRIAVNDELGELERALEDAVDLLAPGGRLTIISFHSLEDRMVKKFFNRLSADCICPPDFPVCVCNTVPKLKVITRKVVTATKKELAENSRAACARLRAAEKI